MHPSGLIKKSTNAYRPPNCGLIQLPSLTLADEANEHVKG
jgi:hypothetical protein